MLPNISKTSLGLMPAASSSAVDSAPHSCSSAHRPARYPANKAPAISSIGPLHPSYALVLSFFNVNCGHLRVSVNGCGIGSCIFLGLFVNPFAMLM